MNTILLNELDYIKKRNTVNKLLDNILEESTFLKVEPDYFENYKDFTELNQRIKEETMIKFISPKGKIILLRPDITTNIIKQLLPYCDNLSNLKLFYNCTVFRQDRNSLKQSRQFGFEVIGNDISSSEEEVLNIILAINQRFNLDIKIDIGFQDFVMDIISSMKLDSKKNALLQSSIMRKSIEGIYQVLDATDSSEESELIKNILQMNGTYEEVISLLSKYKVDISKLKVLESLSKHSEVKIDLSLISDFDYYSGIIIKGYLPNTKKPFLYGGRYDRLFQQYDKKLKAVGVSFDIQAVLEKVNL